MRFSCASCSGLTLARFALLQACQGLNRILESLSWFFFLMLTVCVNCVDLEVECYRMSGEDISQSGRLVCGLPKWRSRGCLSLGTLVCGDDQVLREEDSLRCALGTEDSPRRGSPVSVASMSLSGIFANLYGIFSVIVFGLFVLLGGIFCFFGGI